MSQPGWYPDPAGTPGRFRFWDGQQWSAETSDQPGSADSPTRGLKPFIALGVIVVLLIVAGVFFVRDLMSDPTRSADPGPLPSSTTTGGDDRSPTPEPSRESPSPQAPTPAPSAPSQPCPTGDPTYRTAHPQDGRIHGGGLSMPMVPGWSAGGVKQYSWAYDVATQTKVIEPHWVSNLAVGALNVADDFDDPRTSAERIVQCAVTSSFYSTDESRVDSRTDLSSKAVTVDGHAGWALRTEIRIDASDVEAEGDVLEVIVVDTDQPEALGMFVGTASIGDDQTIGELDSTVQSLRVE